MFEDRSLETGGVWTSLASGQPPGDMEMKVIASRLIRVHSRLNAAGMAFASYYRETVVNPSRDMRF